MTSHAARARLLLSIVVLASSATHCASSVNNGDGGTDATSQSPCPATVPTAGASCTHEGLACGYGDDPRVMCRPVATCMQATWSVNTPTCTPLPPTTCPATREAAQGQSCSPMDAYCSYEGVACRCTNCVFYPLQQCQGPMTWHCDAPNADAQCPPGSPNVGGACTIEGHQCTYGCEHDASRTCQGGVWVASSSPGGCPVSTRRAKRNIEYLSDSEVERLAGDVIDTRLATYEYTDPALAGRRRLGFILEDRPAASFAADPEHSQVDLYGYTSLLVAAVQSQQRRIDRLEAEVAALRDRTPHVAPARRVH